MASSAYYFANPQYDPTRSRPVSLGSIVGNIATIGFSVASEGIFGAMALYPALPKTALTKKFYNKIPIIKDTLQKYEEAAVARFGNALQLEGVEGFPITMTGKLSKVSQQAFETLRGGLFEAAGVKKLSFHDIYKLIKPKGEEVSNIAKLWQQKAWRPMLIGGWGTTAIAMWQRADIWTLGLTLGEMAFRGLQALGKLKQRFIVAQTMQGFLNVESLSSTPTGNLFGEELYFMQQNIQNHVMTRQLMDSEMFENPYNMYRLI